jgi:hypothetical protein
LIEGRQPIRVAKIDLTLAPGDRVLGYRRPPPAVIAENLLGALLEYLDRQSDLGKQPEDPE